MDELFAPDKKTMEKADEPETIEIVEVLEGYRAEATAARRTGVNARDAKWEENLDLYWGRVDFSKKADWQAKEVMPEVPTFVDRFSAALKEALIASPDSFYTVTDPADQEGDITGAVKRMTDVWLSTSGRSQNGQILAFPSVFEEQVKMGALMACASVTTWKDKRVSIETVDPRFVWLDHTGRNLYRIRRVEIDKHELKKMARETDSKGDALFNLDQIEAVANSIASEDQIKREQLSGTGQQITSTREPIVLDEYIATVVGRDGKVIAEDALFVVANEKFLLRGPEKNPFWHKKDWLTFTPLVTTPLSVYGRSYMEDFGSVAKTFTILTNLILDAVYTSSLNAFAVIPEMLENPGQLSEGITPNKMFMLEGGQRAADFIQTIDLGNVSPESFKVWQAIKSELREAADINEVGLGQFAPKGRTSATEITQTQESSNSLIRSIAHTVETHWLDPTLDLVWKTGLQHIDPKDSTMRAVAGEEMFDALIARRKELVQKPLTFRARGISSLIQKAQLLRSIMQVLQVMGTNELLLREFLQQIDIGKLVDLIIDLSGVDKTRLQLSEREKLIKQVAQPLEERRSQVEADNQGRVAAAGQQQDGQEIAKALGVSNQ